ncbi:DNA starvation/stationary phase protection protein [Marivirga sp. S37H4]|uniref:DNA starvation/stationary phase protection protein n=1 Tax=Marivirga aurantiaca TaxID=2802615 RepID=A0A935CBL9_9BACT|nr:DNA starvation/stationary phase protection protein [Marivirga aurantiaca]MBK6266862.1 DNA starvation/stationary phase protection protein [Marivirga aurantiaca]
MTSTKRYRKLGFDQKETKRLVEAMNTLLANYHLHYQKLRNFHWNVKGADFFDLHEQFEERYDIAKESIDEIAERIRVFGQTPLSNLSDYLEHSNIKEAKTDVPSDDMVKEILKDYEILLSYLTDAMNAAIDIGDVGTEDMLNTFIQDMEKHHWMLSSFLGK